MEIKYTTLDDSVIEIKFAPALNKHMLVKAEFEHRLLKELTAVYGSEADIPPHYLVGLHIFSKFITRIESADNLPFDYQKAIKYATEARQAYELWMNMEEAFTDECLTALDAREKKASVPNP